jgi:hypothetical protein
MAGRFRTVPADLRHCGNRAQSERRQKGSIACDPPFGCLVPLVVLRTGSDERAAGERGLCRCAVGWVRGGDDTPDCGCRDRSSLAAHSVRERT